MNSSYTYVTAVVILVAFMRECSGTVLELPRVIPIMRDFVLTVRSEREHQINTEGEKSVPHLCSLPQDVLEEVCEEAIFSKIVGIALILPATEKARCDVRRIVGTKSMKRMIECPSRYISWDRQHLEEGIGPLENNYVEKFYVGASTSTENKVQLFLPVQVNGVHKAIGLCEISDFELPNHPDVKFIDNDLRVRFMGNENDNRYDDGELNAVLQSDLLKNDALQRSKRPMMEMTVTYD